MVDDDVALLDGAPVILLAQVQQRSIISATPVRPSERSAAQIGKARARREASGVQSIASRVPVGR